MPKFIEPPAGPKIVAKDMGHHMQYSFTENGLLSSQTHVDNMVDAWYDQNLGEPYTDCEHLTKPSYLTPNGQAALEKLATREKPDGLAQYQEFMRIARKEQS